MLAVIPSAARDLLSALVNKEGRWALVTAGLLVCGYCALTFHREAPAPLPSSVAKLVERQAVENAVDSSAIKRLTRSAAKQRVRHDTETARARAAADSGQYRAAYVLADSALAAADREVALLDVALTRSQQRALMADSVVAAVLPIAQSREPPCRVLWVVPCPTRRAVAALAVAATATLIIGGQLVRPKG